MRPFVGEFDAEVAVVGADAAAWAAALELREAGREVAVVAVSGASSELGHLTLGTARPFTELVDRFGAGARELLDVQRENHERLRALLGLLGDDCGYRASGGFLMARDRAEAEALADSEDALRDEGFSGEFLDHYMLEARFGLPGFAGAYWAVDEGEVDPDRLLDALGQAAVDRGVVRLETDSEPELNLSGRGVEVVTSRGRLRAPEAVVTAGLDLPGLRGRLARRESRMLLAALEPEAALPSPARLVGGGAAWRRIDERRLRLAGHPAELEAVADLLPATSARQVDRGAVIAGRDGLPVIGLLPGLPVAVVCGGGLSSGIIGGRWAAEALASGADPAPSLLRPGRPLDDRGLKQ